MLRIGIACTLLMLLVAVIGLVRSCRAPLDSNPELVRWDLCDGSKHRAPLLIAAPTCYIRISLEPAPGSTFSSFGGDMEIIDPLGDTVYEFGGVFGQTGDAHPVMDPVTVHALRVGEYRLRVTPYRGQGRSRNTHMVVRDITDEVFAALTNQVTGIDDACKRLETNADDRIAADYLKRFWARNAHDREAVAHLLTNTLLPNVMCDPQYTVGSTVQVTFARSILAQPQYPNGPYEYEIGFVFDEKRSNQCWRMRGGGNGGSGARLYWLSLADEPGSHELRSWCRFRWFSGYDEDRLPTNEVWRMEWQGAPVMFDVVAAPPTRE